MVTILSSILKPQQSAPSKVTEGKSPVYNAPNEENDDALRFEQLLASFDKFFEQLKSACKNDIAPVINSKNAAQSIGLTGNFAQSVAADTKYILPIEHLEMEITFTPASATLNTQAEKPADAKQIFHFVLAAREANASMVTEGIFIDENDGTPLERALALLAAQRLNLNVSNEADLFKTIDKDVMAAARAEFGNFTKDNKALLDAAGKQFSDIAQPTIGKMRGTLNETTGFAHKSVGYMTKDDFDKVGQIQAELMVIRDAVTPEVMEKLPKFNGKPDLGGLINKDDERAALIDELGARGNLPAALVIANSGKGVQQKDGALFVPMSGMIQERTVIKPAAKDAFLVAQFTERLMKDVARLATVGANPNAEPPKDMRYMEGKDPAIVKGIQEARQALSDRERGATSGAIVDGKDILARVSWPEVKAESARLYDKAIDGESDEKKINALKTLKSYTQTTVAFHLRKNGMETGSAPSGTAPGSNLA